MVGQAEYKAYGAVLLVTGADAEEVNGYYARGHGRYKKLDARGGWFYCYPTKRMTVARQIQITGPNGRSLEQSTGLGAHSYWQISSQTGGAWGGATRHYASGVGFCKQPTRAGCGSATLIITVL